MHCIKDKSSLSMALSCIQSEESDGCAVCSSTIFQPNVSGQAFSTQVDLICTAYCSIVQ